MGSINLAQLEKRLDLLDGTKQPERFGFTVDFVSVGEPQPITRATINGTPHTPSPGESDQDFCSRLRAAHPYDLILLSRE